MLTTFVFAQDSNSAGSSPTSQSPTAGSNPANLPQQPQESAEGHESSSVSAPATVDTSDKSVSKWAAEDVDWMVSNNIVPPQLQYSYKNYITREEFASLAVSVLNFMSKSKVNLIQTMLENKFKDTDSLDVAKAYSFGIVNGVSEEEFKPNNNITRQEAAMMMSNLLQSIQSEGLSKEDYTYKDRHSISGWALDAVDITSNFKLFQGSDAGFQPYASYTREQAIAVMRRLLQYQGSTHEISLRGKVFVDLNNLGTEEYAKSNKAKPVFVIAGTSNVRFTWTEATPDSSRLLDKLLVDLTAGHEGHNHEKSGVLVFQAEEVNSLKSSTGPVTIGDYTLATGSTQKADEGYLLQITW